MPARIIKPVHGKRLAWRGLDVVKAPDLTVSTDGGSIYLLRPETDAGKSWITDHLPPPPDSLWWGDAIVIEHRYIEPIVRAARDAGLEVK